MSKEMKQLVKQIEANGYTVVQSGRNHLKVKNEAGGTVATMPGTPSDHRSILNTRAQMRRLGVLTS
jgi:hypothetical protein